MMREVIKTYGQLDVLVKTLMPQILQMLLKAAVLKALNPEMKALRVTLST